jgi:hypothetical protein
MTSATGAPAIGGLIYVNWSQEGTLVRGRSDYSEYPALFDYTHHGFRFQMNCRSDSQITLWSAARWIQSFSLQIQPLCGAGSTIWTFVGNLIEKPQFEMTVGELGYFSIRGTSTSIQRGNQKVEGNLNQIRHGQSPNVSMFTADTSNHWKPRGVL